jgi:hypothetical protein
MRSAQAFRRLPWAVRGAGVCGGAVSFVVAGQEARRALREGDVSRATQIVAATTVSAAAGGAAARKLPELPGVRKPEEHTLITFLRGVKERRTLLAWQEKGGIRVVEAREVVPQYTTERVRWKPEVEPGVDVPFHVRERVLRAEYREGRLSALGAEEKRRMESVVPQSVRQVREIRTGRGTPEETGVAVLEKEVLVEHGTAAKKPLKRAPLPGELVERVPERVVRRARVRRGRTVPYEPPAAKPRRRLPRRVRGGREPAAADVSKVEADVRRIIMRGRAVQEAVLDEPAVVGMRRVRVPERLGVRIGRGVSGRTGRFAAGVLSGVLGRVLRGVSGARAAQKQDLLLVQRTGRAQAADEKRVESAAREVLVTARMPVVDVVPATAVVPAPATPRAPGLGRILPPGSPAAPKPPARLKTERKREKAEKEILRLFAGKRQAEEFVMPFFGFRTGKRR